jgi:hypothetical protein
MLSRSATRPRRHNAPRPAEKSCPRFLQWIRGRGCLACNAGCTDRVEAAHVDYAGGKGVGSKVADRYAVPLCGGPAGHHAEQHRRGWKTFERQYFGEEGYALKAAEAYWRAWPGRIAWERKQEGRA